MRQANPFIEKSPSGILPGGPRYTYVLNNPLKYTDPSGYTFENWNEVYAVINYLMNHTQHGGSSDGESINVYNSGEEAWNDNSGGDGGGGGYWSTVSVATGSSNSGKRGFFHYGFHHGRNRLTWHKGNFQRTTTYEDQLVWVPNNVPGFDAAAYWLHQSIDNSYYPILNESELDNSIYRNISSSASAGGYFARETAAAKITSQKSNFYSSSSARLWTKNQDKLLYSNYNPILRNVKYVGDGFNLGGSALGVILDYSKIIKESGSVEPIIYVDAFAGTAELASQANRFIFGSTIPGVGQITAIYGFYRLSWELGVTTRQYYDYKLEQKAKRPRVLDIDWDY